MPAASLDGRRIVVTGGASGMGAGLARGLPRLGARFMTGQVFPVDGGMLMVR